MGHLLEDRLGQQKITLDALHLIPITLRSIHQAEGYKLVGLKANQVTLYRQCTCQTVFNFADYEYVDVEQKRHGWTKQRTYRFYSLDTLWLAPRWQTMG